MASHIIIGKALGHGTNELRFSVLFHSTAGDTVVSFGSQDDAEAAILACNQTGVYPVRLYKKATP